MRVWARARAWMCVGVGVQGVGLREQGVAGRHACMRMRVGGWGGAPAAAGVEGELEVACKPFLVNERVITLVPAWEDGTSEVVNH